MARKAQRAADFEVLQDELRQLLKRDPRLVILASGWATHTMPDPANWLAHLAKDVATRYPARFYGLGDFQTDLPATTARLQAEGKQPLVLMGSDDLARTYAGMTEICSSHQPVIFLLTGGQTDLMTDYQSQALAILRTFPRLFIGVPSSPLELANQLSEARHAPTNPVAICYWLGERRRPAVIPSATPPGLGRAVMLREGKELALLSIGSAVKRSMALAAKLDEAGHQAAVVDVRWVRPLDEALLTAVAHYFPRLVTVEDGVDEGEGTMGAAVMEMLEQREQYQTRLKRIGLPPNSNVTKLSHKIISFLDTLKRDEGLTPSP
jgi:1-deoxy-D-xylulose-5-phosphate synthase